MTRIDLNFTVNSNDTAVSVRVNATLLDILRDTLGLMGTHDGKPANACLVLAPDVAGRTVTTVEGLAVNGSLSDVQKSFIEYGALQCGYCTSGMIMSATAMLNEHGNNLTEAQVRQALAGNLCRSAAAPDTPRL